MVRDPVVPAEAGTQSRQYHFETTLRLHVGKQKERHDLRRCDV